MLVFCKRSRNNRVKKFLIIGSFQSVQSLIEAFKVDSNFFSKQPVALKIDVERRCTISLNFVSNSQRQLLDGKIQRVPKTFVLKTHRSPIGGHDAFLVAIDGPPVV